MKRQTLLTLTLLLSLFLAAIPARAASLTREVTMDLKKSAHTPTTFNTTLEDIINSLPEGHHDTYAGVQSPFFCRAEGWAADPDDRAVDLNIRVFSDGVEIVQTIADTYRQDLADAGVCQDGTCSFSLNLWDLITPDTDHLILVQAQDAQTGEWATLYDTPKTLNCFTPQAAALVVNSTADSADANPGDHVCETFMPGECTLRAAIQEANASPGADTINFDIPGAGPYTISPFYELDPISDPVTIDGTTQPSFAGTPIIELEGSNAGPDAHGLFIYAGSSTVRGLVINRFTHTGIEIEVNGGNVIQGNYIGTDVTGTLALGNGDYDGLLILTPNNTIGGTTLAARNIISGNKGQGIRMQGSEASGNIVQGNFIGVDSTGTAALGNGTDCCHSGIVMHLGASNNLIGGSVPGAGNVISGNTADGVTIADAGTTGNIVAGNFIGTDVTGTQDVGNAFDGVVMVDGTSENLIGGTEAGAGNVLSGNGANGVAIYQVGTMGNLVQGNHIGSDVTGTLALNNSGHGVAIAAGASNNLIGGTSSGAGNTIVFNNASGVLLGGDAGTGNASLSNSIHSNGDLGIDLGEDGVTLNDLFDTDGGSNNLQNFPFITDVRSKGKGLTIQGILVSAGNTTFQIQFFSNDSCDPSGYGEGQTYLGSAWVTTPPVGRAQFKITLQAPLPNGSFITATATDPVNNTSEFSQCVQASP
jgi:CSLREA domain-containing protein